MDEAQVPAVLKTEEQWVCWRTEHRNGKSTKVPLNPYTEEYARADAPDTWSDFDTAYHQYTAAESVNGIGFMFHETGPYAGVDLDDCRDPGTGTVDDWAVEVMRRLDSYTERSPSGTGFHVIVSGHIPDGGNRQGNLEMYDSRRYFTVTGDWVPGGPTTVTDRADALAEIHREYIVDEDQQTEPTPTDYLDVNLRDEELIEKAKHAADGDKFKVLWSGDISGYKSHSEADQALCTLLAFWTGGDAQRIEHLFSQSGLVREKWWNREDYRERTINTAIENCSEFYQPPNEE